MSHIPPTVTVSKRASTSKKKTSENVPKKSKVSSRKLKKHDVPQYTIYTDGSFRPPCYGAWATIILDSDYDEREILSGHEFDTTISRMELTAIIKGLEAIPDPVAKIVIVSDSLYAVMSIMVWINYWKGSNWRTASGGKVKNMDLMKRLYELKNKFMIRAFHIKSHTGENRYNDSVDKICSQLTLDMKCGKLKRPEKENVITTDIKQKVQSVVNLKLPDALSKKLNASYLRNKTKT
jgi:ribonuclease HI